MIAAPMIASEIAAPVIASEIDAQMIASEIAAQMIDAPIDDAIDGVCMSPSASRRSRCWSFICNKIEF